MKPSKLTVEWSGSCRVDFDAEVIACDLDEDASDDAIRDAIESDAITTASDQSHATGRVRGIGPDHIAAIRAELAKRGGDS